MTVEIGQELAWRMAALVRNLADQSNTRAHVSWRDVTEARAIVAELLVAVDPDLVDPDLAEARAVVVAVNSHPSYSGWTKLIAEGRDDNHVEVRGALAAIKRGRALAQGERS